MDSLVLLIMFIIVLVMFWSLIRKTKDVAESVLTDSLNVVTDSMSVATSHSAKFKHTQNLSIQKDYAKLAESLATETRMTQQEFEELLASSSAPVNAETTQA